MIALMPIWATAKAFFKVNWKWVVIGLVLVFAYFKVGSWYDAYQEAEAAERERITRLEVEKASAQVSLASMAATLQIVMEEKRKQEVLLLDAISRQDRIRAEAKEQVDVFEDHDFPKLVEAKPGLIEKLANKATNERMQQLEDALNE